MAWGDLCYFKDNIVSILISCLIGPVLYLVAFGYGLGNSMQGGADNYIQFIIPGIISMATLSTTFSFVSSKVMIQKIFYSSFDELLLCPIKTSSVVLGKSLVGVLRGLLSCTVIMAIGSILSPGIQITPFLFVLVLVSSLTFSLLGILAALIAKRHNTLNVFSSLVIVPMTFLCGTIFKISDVPAALGYIIRALPLTQPTEAIRAEMLNEALPWLSILIMCAYCVIFYALDYFIIKTGKY